MIMPENEYRIIHCGHKMRILVFLVDEYMFYLRGSGHN